MENENMRWEMTLDVSSQILCEFYNLNLEHVEKVRDFLERHASIKNMADEVERLKTGVGVELTYELLGSLEFYEYQNGVSWFDSEDYDSFVNHHGLYKSLVSSALARNLDIHLLHRFRQQIEKSNYKSSIDFQGKDGKFIQETELAGKMPDSVSLDDWEIVPTHRFDTMEFGMHLKSLVFDVYQALEHVMRDPNLVRQCASTCHRIFTNRSRKGIYCSDMCLKEGRSRKTIAAKNENKLRKYKKHAKNFVCLPTNMELTASEIQIWLSQHKKELCTPRQLAGWLRQPEFKEVLKSQEGLTFSQHHDGKKYNYCFQKQTPSRFRLVDR